MHDYLRKYIFLFLSSFGVMAATFVSLSIAKNQLSLELYNDFVLSLRYLTVLIPFTMVGMGTSMIKFYNSLNSSKDLNIEITGASSILLGFLISSIAFIVISMFYPLFQSNLIFMSWTITLLGISSLSSFQYIRLKARGLIKNASLFNFIFRGLFFLLLVYINIFNFKSMQLLIVGMVISILLLFIFKATSNKAYLRREVIRYGFFRMPADMVFPLLLNIPLLFLNSQGLFLTALNLSIALMVINGLIALIAPGTELLQLWVSKKIANSHSFIWSTILVSFFMAILFLLLIDFFILFFGESVTGDSFESISIVVFLYTIAYISQSPIDMWYSKQINVILGFCSILIEVLTLFIFNISAIPALILSFSFYALASLFFLFLAISKG